MSERSILLATDFSQVSQHATEHAIDLATQLEMKLVVLHVFDERTFKVPSLFYFMPDAEGWEGEAIAKVRLAASEKLEALIQSIPIPTMPIFREGKPGPTIVDVVQELDPAFVVLGTHGYEGLRRSLLGSVAEYVLRRASCPVITLRHDPKSA